MATEKKLWEAERDAGVHIEYRDANYSANTKGARRCTNPDCEYGGRWIVRGMRLLKNGKFNCL